MSSSATMYFFSFSKFIKLKAILIIYKTNTQLGVLFNRQVFKMSKNKLQQFKYTNIMIFNQIILYDL